MVDKYTKIAFRIKILMDELELDGKITLTNGIVYYD